jgi:hypothetical protein
MIDRLSFGFCYWCHHVYLRVSHNIFSCVATHLQLLRRLPEWALRTREARRLRWLTVPKLPPVSSCIFLFESLTRTCLFDKQQDLRDRPFLVPSTVIMVPTAACVPFSEVRLQDRGQPCRARARGRDFGSNSVAQPHSVKPVAVMSDVFDCLEVHYGMPSDLDERIAT